MLPIFFFYFFLPFFYLFPFLFRSYFHISSANERTTHFAWSIMISFDIVQVLGSHQNVFTIKLIEGKIIVILIFTHYFCMYFNEVCVIIILVLSIITLIITLIIVKIILIEGTKIKMLIIICLLIYFCIQVCIVVYAIML